MNQESDRPPPYVGVSGITTREQAKAILGMWPQEAPPRSLMLGVLASSKTLCGLTNKWPMRYPKAEDIGAVFVDDPRALNLVHVACDSDPSKVDGKRIPAEIDMLRAYRCGGSLCHGIQLNGATTRLRWQTISDCRAWVPKPARFVMQVGPKWLSSRLEAASALGSLVMYAGSITDLLIDVSGGRGRMVDPVDALDLISEIRTSLKHYGVAEGSVRIGIAGGLCAETLSAVANLVREHDLSIDAEGRLRNERDELDLDKVRVYLDVAARSRGWMG